jgi:hypothetical protein
MNQDVLIITPSFEKFSVVKGKVVGCYQVNATIYKFRYIIDTFLGRYERFPDAIFESEQEIKDKVSDYVVEEPSEGK